MTTSRMGAALDPCCPLQIGSWIKCAVKRVRNEVIEGKSKRNKEGEKEKEEE